MSQETQKLGFNPMKRFGLPPERTRAGSMPRQHIEDVSRIQPLVQDDRQPGPEPTQEQGKAQFQPGQTGKVKAEMIKMTDNTQL